MAEKGIVVVDGYAEPGEPVVPGAGPGCVGLWSRKLAFEGRVVRLEHPVEVLAEETLRAFYGQQVIADARVAEEAERIRRLYGQVQTLRVGARVRLPSDAEEPVVEPMGKRRS